MIQGDGRMSNPEEASAQTEHSERPVSRRPYVKPEFSYEHVFETTALKCSPSTGSTTS
jgi:hypothetical protein